MPRLSLVRWHDLLRFAGLTAVVGCALLLMGDVAQAAGAKLSIRTYPDGVFGFLTGASKGCSAERKVFVYEAQGDGRSLARDRKVAGARVGESEGRYLWAAETNGAGRFYARVAAKKGCGVASSAVVSVPLAATAGGDPQYPPCSPYTSEGTSNICQFSEMYMDLDQEGSFNPCRFGADSGGCPGRAKAGTFPWGKGPSGGSTGVQFSWHWNGSDRVIEVASDGNAGRLDGTVPGAGSERFTVTNAFARNDEGGNNGDNFYTPNLPGQKPGEPGGPLKLNFLNGGGLDFGAEAWISGYLFLKGR